MRRLSAVAILVAFAACSPSRRPVVAPQPSAADRLAVVDAELRAGCLDCLIDALARYEALRQSPAAAEAATAGAIRAAVLIAVRQRELGMADEGYLAKARALAAQSPNVPAWLLKIVDVADALPGSRGAGGRPPSTDADLDRLRTLRAHRDEWTAATRDAARFDEAAAYVWLALMCDSTDARQTPTAEVFDGVSAFAGSPLVVYREALCRTIDAGVLQRLLDDDRRFVEINYSLGLASLGARPRPEMDDAERSFERAYAWRPRWPTLTLAMAGLAMTAEDFDRALALYDETLAVDGRDVEALLGKTRALTYAARHDAAIATADQLIAERWYVGDARYWRALNETELARDDAAWTDVEEAEKALVNAEVPKLAGIVAYRRHHLDVAVDRFTTSQARNPFDCETRFYLGVIRAERREWPETATTLQSAAACFEAAEQGLRREIERIDRSDLAADRKARQIARREQQIAEGRRRIATSWFDVAVADFSLEKKDEAREYAEKLADDEEFGARARELLTRLR